MSRSQREAKPSVRELRKLASKLLDVPLAQIRVSTEAQRDLRPHRVTELASHFDPELFGHPVVSMRAGYYYVIDGNHRIAAVKLYLGDGWEKQEITCRVYSDLSEADEAELYLGLNNQLAQSAFDKFKVGVTAGLPTELAVKHAVERAGLTISRNRGDGNLSAVSTLLRIHARADVATVERTLRLVYQSFGTPGLTNPVIDGMALICERYNGALSDRAAVERLSAMRGGVGALVTRATNYRKQTGNQLPYCVAAAIVDAINGRGKKLASWWRDEQ